VFGISFGELVLVAVVALVVVGPQKLPGMLRTTGSWIARMRRMVTEVRNQSGIDDILRSEGLEGGLNELRSLVRGGGALPLGARSLHDAHASRRPEPFVEDRSREYPVEGPDAHGAVPEDLLPQTTPSAVESPRISPEPSAGAATASEGGA